MPKRSTHSKSRRGCLLCKRRKVKCDEKQPSCGNCVSREEVCQYAPLDALTWVQERAIPYRSQKSRAQNKGSDNETINSADSAINQSIFGYSGAKRCEEVGAANLHLNELELMMHWCTSTIYTVAFDPEAARVSQEFLSKEALQHEFLMHGLLALSALHLADSRDAPEKPRYRELALEHHDLGLAKFRPQLGKIGESNYSACIGFSSLTLMFSCAIARPTEVADNLTAVDSFAQTIMLAKGWQDIVNEAQPFHGQKSLEEDLPEDGVLSDEIEEALNQLHRLNNTIKSDSANSTSPHQTEVYKRGINSLRSVFRLLQENAALNPHTALRWTHIVPDSFVNLLKQGQLMALIILAHFCVILHQVSNVWWLRGWDTSLFKSIWHNITLEYRPYLHWPKLKMSWSDDCQDSKKYQSNGLE